MSEMTQMAADPQPVIGYCVNADFSPSNAQILAAIIEKLHRHLPDAIWPMPTKTLHITLFDWVAPLVDYGRNKDELFQQLRAEYTAAFKNILAGRQPIALHFNEIKITPGAVIAVATDDGSFTDIRHQFTSSIKLTEGTKPPPQFIHSSLCRYMSQVDTYQVRDTLGGESISFDQIVTGFKLTKELLAPMQKFEVLETFELS